MGKAYSAAQDAAPGVTGISTAAESVPSLQSYLLSCVHEAMAAVDENKHIVYWNNAAEELTGWPKEDVLGKPAGDALRLRTLSGEPITEAALSTGERRGEFICCRRNGTSFPIALHSHAIRNNKGKFQGIAASFRDITAQKKGEAFGAFFSDIGSYYGMRLPARQLHQITGEKTAAYLAVTAHILFGWVSEQTDEIEISAGYSAQALPEVAGKYCLSGIIGETALMELRTGRPVAADDTAKDPRAAVWADSPPFCGVRSALITSCIENGRLVFVIIAQHCEPRLWQADETEMLQMMAERTYRRIELARNEEALQKSERRALDLAKQLEDKNRFITDFFINVSHEFKTPLTILMLGLELLDNKTKALAGYSADISRNISVIRQNSYRLNRLVSNLLDITKLDAGFMDPKWELADVVALLRNLVASTETYARQKQLTMRFITNTDEKRMLTDGFILERIMLNLLSNAIKHTQDGGQIDVICRVADGSATISVKDNGEGIPENKKGIVFDRFSQVDTSLARSSDGSGIGLALTKSLVELMEGRVWFESAEGVGSEFFVELPVVHKEYGRKNKEYGLMQLDRRVQMEFSGIGLNIG